MELYIKEHCTNIGIQSQVTQVETGQKAEGDQNVEMERVKSEQEIEIKQEEEIGKSSECKQVESHKKIYNLQKNHVNNIKTEFKIESKDEDLKCETATLYPAAKPEMFSFLHCEYSTELKSYLDKDSKEHLELKIGDISDTAKSKEKISAENFYDDSMYDKVKKRRRNMTSKISSEININSEDNGDKEGNNEKTGSEVEHAENSEDVVTWKTENLNMYDTVKKRRCGKMLRSLTTLGNNDKDLRNCKNRMVHGKCKSTVNIDTVNQSLVMNNKAKKANYYSPAKSYEHKSNVKEKNGNRCNLNNSPTDSTKNTTRKICLSAHLKKDVCKRKTKSADIISCKENDNGSKKLENCTVDKYTKKKSEVKNLENNKNYVDGRYVSSFNYDAASKLKKNLDLSEDKLDNQTITTSKCMYDYIKKRRQNVTTTEGGEKITSMESSIGYVGQHSNYYTGTQENVTVSADYGNQNLDDGFFQCVNDRIKYRLQNVTPRIKGGTICIKENDENICIKENDENTPSKKSRNNESFNFCIGFPKRLNNIWHNKIENTVVSENHGSKKDEKSSDFNKKSAKIITNCGNSRISKTFHENKSNIYSIEFKENTVEIIDGKTERRTDNAEKTCNERNENTKRDFLLVAEAKTRNSMSHSISKVTNDKKRARETQTSRLNANDQVDKYFHCYFCSFKTLKRIYLSSHIQKQHNFNPEIFKCTKCAFQTKHKGNLKTHDSRFHNSERMLFRCARCSFKTLWEKSLSQHMARHNDNPQIHKCELCSFHTNHRWTLRYHYRRMHYSNSDKVYRCFHCGFTGRMKIDLVQHIRRLHIEGNELFKCAKCQYQTRHKDYLKQHCKIHDKSKTYICEICNDYKTHVKKGLRDHLRRKHSTKKVKQIQKCEFCPYKAFVKRTVDRHVTIVHSDKNILKCSSCSFETKWKPDLTKHLKSHTGEMFPCSECNYTGKSKILLKMHFDRMHVENCQMFHCQQCDYVNKNKGKVDRHFRAVHDETSVFKCSWCSFNTKWKDHLRIHIRSKHDENAEVLKCFYCPYETKSKPCLTCHLKRHKENNSELFGCHICGFETVWKQGLRNHFRNVHFDGPKHKCPHCEHETKSKSRLQDHVKNKHLKPMQYNCADCSYSSNSKFSLRDHRWFAHGKKSVI